MIDKTHLEEALEFLINEEDELAVASFHNFIVQKARAIHESLMEDDELDEEIDSDDEEVTEAKSDDDEEVTEAKSDDDEETVEEGMNEFYRGTDLGEMPEDEMTGDDYAGDEEGGMDMDMEGGETVEVPVDDLEALQMKFDELMVGAGLGDEEMGGEEGEMDMDMDMGGEEESEPAYEDRFNVGHNPLAESDDEDDDEDDDEAVEEAVTHDPGVVKDGTDGADADGKTGGGTDAVKHNSDAKLPENFDYDLTEEDFLDLEEGLKSVSVSMGGEQGGVKYAGEETQTVSPVAQKDKSDVKADSTSLVSKQKEHGDFKREGAPSNDKLPHSNENNHDKAEGTPGRSSVAGHGGLESNSGQGGEQGKKKFAGTETNTKSIIGSTGSRTEK